MSWGPWPPPGLRRRRGAVRVDWPTLGAPQVVALSDRAFRAFMHLISFVAWVDDGGEVPVEWVKQGFRFEAGGRSRGLAEDVLGELERLGLLERRTWDDGLVTLRVRGWREWRPCDPSSAARKRAFRKRVYGTRYYGTLGGLASLELGGTADGSGGERRSPVPAASGSGPGGGVAV